MGAQHDRRQQGSLLLEAIENFAQISGVLQNQTVDLVRLAIDKLQKLCCRIDCLQLVAV
jgi:hypothetical protein